MQVKKQQIELDMEQQTGSNLGKEYVKAAHFHPAYLTYRWVTKNFQVVSKHNMWLNYPVALDFSAIKKYLEDPFG